MSKRREAPYPPEFKESAVKLALESNSIAQTARGLGIKVNTLLNYDLSLISSFLSDYHEFSISSSFIQQSLYYQLK